MIEICRWLRCINGDMWMMEIHRWWRYIDDVSVMNKEETVRWSVCISINININASWSPSPPTFCIWCLWILDSIQLLISLSVSYQQSLNRWKTKASPIHTTIYLSIYLSIHSSIHSFIYRPHRIVPRILFRSRAGFALCTAALSRRAASSVNTWGR